MERFNLQEFLFEQIDAQQFNAHQMRWLLDVSHDGFFKSDDLHDICRQADYLSYVALNKISRDTLRSVKVKTTLLIAAILNSAKGDVLSAVHKLDLLLKFIEDEGISEITRTEKETLMSAKNSDHVRNILDAYIRLIEHPKLVERSDSRFLYDIHDNGIKAQRAEHDFWRCFATYVSYSDNLVYYFDKDYPVLVKIFDDEGEFQQQEDVFMERVPKYINLSDNMLGGKRAWAISPLYQIVKTERMLQEIFAFLQMQTKPVRKIIVMPNRNTKVGGNYGYIEGCNELGIEIKHSTDFISTQFQKREYDIFDEIQVNTSADMLAYMYNTFRSIDRNFIREVLDDIYGKELEINNYKEEIEHIEVDQTTEMEIVPRLMDNSEVINE